MRYCGWCGKPLEEKTRIVRFCNRKCSSMGWYSKEGEKNAKKHHKAEIERQKIENERIKTQLIAFRLMKTCINSSPDAMRELAGLKSLEIKEASTYNELILGYII